MNLIELGEATDCEYDKEHCCDANQFPRFDRLVHCVSSHEQPMDSWQMHNIHYATLEDVEMGEAEHVDEITYHSMLLVNYCPFCGTKLSANEAPQT